MNATADKLADRRQLIEREVTDEECRCRARFQSLIVTGFRNLGFILCWLGFSGI